MGDGAGTDVQQNGNSAAHTEAEGSVNDHRNLGRRYDKRLRTWRADTDRAGVPGDRRAIPLGSCSLEIPPSTQAKTYHPASRRTGASTFRPLPGATACCEADPCSRRDPAHAARVLCSRDRTCLWPSWPHHTDGGREGQRIARPLPAGGTGGRARVTNTNHGHEPRPCSKVAIRILTEW